MTSDGHVNCKGAGVCLPVGHVSKWIEQSLYLCRVRMVGVVEVVSVTGRKLHQQRPKKQRVQDARRS